MEVQIEIGLPDENGRIQILGIHSNKMKENSFLSADVDLEALGMPLLSSHRRHKYLTCESYELAV